MTPDRPDQRLRRAAVMAALFALVPLAACGPGRTAPAAERITPRSEVLVGAFLPGFKGEGDEGESYAVTVTRLGDIALPSGRLILSDALVGFTDTPALDLAIPPGRWPVDLAIADTGPGGHRVALARLRWSEADPVRWTMAHTPQTDPAALDPDEIAGYPVDSGTAGFFDASAVEALKRRHSPHDVAAWTALGERWIAAGEAGGRRLGQPHLFAHVETFDGGGVALTSSGWGDGFYGSWIGWDARDRPVQLVTDFQVIRAANLPSTLAPEADGRADSSRR